MWLIGVILGVAVGAAILAFIFWLRNNGVQAKWYEWLIGIIGVLLVLFAIQNFFGSLAEFESGAGSMYLLVTGLPGVILGALAWILIQRRQRTAG
jgi:uncharacterized YccA/Bax inhibitor family protein